MVTRRFKKGSVYDTLASTSGLDFSPVVQLKTYNPRRSDSSPQVHPPKPPDKSKEKSPNLISENCSSKESEEVSFNEECKQECASQSFLNMNPQSPPESKQLAPDGNVSAKCIAAHEKYPSWPVVGSESSSVSYRSHSWTGQTDYPKEKVGYSRPKKDYQYKISTNQLQPVLERTTDYNNSGKTSEEAAGAHDRNTKGESYRFAYRGCPSSLKDCNGKQFDFEAFHTPCIPHCYEDKDYTTHSPPERDGSLSSTSVSKTHTESATNDSSGFRGRYEDVFRNEAQYSAPLPSTWNKTKTIESESAQSTPDTPFLDRLRMENAWQMPPPPVPVQQPVAPSLQLQLQEQQQGNDFEMSSENGTWMGSMESSSHGRGIPKWQGSYSDLSTLSTQLSNRSSLFDSGHSTMPESGRLSPQSSCDSMATSLLLEGPTRAQVVARHGCHREIVAHSARVQQPERHGSESVLYYATGSSSRPKLCDNNSKISQRNVEPTAGASNITTDEASFCSHASVTLSPTLPKSNIRESVERRNKTQKCPTRQDSRNSSNSFSSDDSFPRFRCPKSDDTSGSSSDVSNITCISNYKNSIKPQRKSLVKPSVIENVQPQVLDKSHLKYKLGYEPPKSKSMDETSRKSVFSEIDKRQRISDPELEAIQKQAVMSFYQRMSLAESIKSDSKPLLHSPSDSEPPPPYEASSPARTKVSAPKLSLHMNKIKQLPSTPISTEIDVPVKASNSGLLNNYSKSVPNLVILKGQSLDLPPSHPFFKRSYNSSQNRESSAQHSQLEKKKGSPLAKDEIISWDQLSNVLEKKREAIEKAAPSSETKDPPEDNGGCTSGLHYLKAPKSPRKVQLKEVHHSNETASVQVMTPEGVTLVQTNEKKAQKRRPAPPPPPKQPPRRPPPPPPPITPPLTQVIVEGSEDLDCMPQCGLSSPSKDSTPSGDRTCPSSPDLPLPPPPTAEEVMMMFDDPLPPPPDANEVDMHPRVLDGTLIYPKNSYMSYRSERKLARQGFDGKYRRSFHTSASSVDLTTIDSSFQDGKIAFSPSSWEQIHNVRQPGTTVIFHSDCLQQNSHIQRSTSQDCVLVEEAALSCSDNISSDTEKNSSTSITNQSPDALHQTMPYKAPSHERINFEAQTCDSDSYETSERITSIYPNDVRINSETTTNDSVDDPLPDNCSSNSEIEPNVDHNQNSLKNNKVGKHVSEAFNLNDLINHINSATQTDAPRLCRKIVKTQEELECEQLSRDFIQHYGGIAFKHLLVPASDHKTLSHYMEGLLSFDLDKSNQYDQQNSSGYFEGSENSQREEKRINMENCSYEAKTKSSEINDNQNVDNEAELQKRKEELIVSIRKKLESLRGEQTIMQAEMHQNDRLGQEISDQLKELAKPNESEKYTLHVEEQEKIVSLLLSLSGRLARAENILRNMPKDCSVDEKRTLETKRNKLKEQHEDACRLKESIDRRSNHVSTFLHKYFSEEEYAKYDHFIKMKIKLLIDIREIDEKINLGEEQLAVLSAVTHPWKSANS